MCSSHKYIHICMRLCIAAIDVWMAVCLGFVFLALVQFAYVNVLSRVEKRRKLTLCGTVGKIALGTSLSAANTGSPSPASPNTPTVTAPSLAKASLPNMSAISESGNSQQSNQDPEVGNAGTQKVCVNLCLFTSFGLADLFQYFIVHIIFHILFL